MVVVAFWIYVPPSSMSACLCSWVALWTSLSLKAMVMFSNCRARSTMCDKMDHSMDFA